MEIRVEAMRADDPEFRERYAQVPIAFRVTTRLDLRLIENGFGGVQLTEIPVPTPYTKDYDAMGGEGPSRWAESFDLSGWTLLIAFAGMRAVGGAALAENKTGLELLCPRSDTALLYDLRVHPEYRGRGIGSHLFAAISERAAQTGFRALEVETQNTNVPACRFYAAQGCELRMLRRNAYPEFPEEILLLWGRDL